MKVTTSQILILIAINILLVNTLTLSQDKLQLLLKEKIDNKQDKSTIELDVNTFCKYLDYNINSYDFKINLDFENKKITGNVQTTIFTETADLAEIIFDVWDINVTKVQVGSNAHKMAVVDVPYDIIHHPDSIQGSSLNIDVSTFYEDGPIPRSKRIEVYIDYETDSENVTQEKGFTFLDADQTLGGEKQFFYTQNEPIYMRTWMPSCDTPAIKSTWTASVTVPSDLKLFMSGSYQEENQNNKDSTTTYLYNNHHHLTPLYYMGIVVGDLEVQKISDKVNVIAEAHHSQDVAQQFKDVQDWITLAENYLGFNYPWEIFQIVVMPPNYPFEGAAHPGLTYVSPSVLISQKEGKSVVMHEVASSFFGNLISCSNWSNVWLNEGLAQFMERIIQTGAFGGSYAHLDRFQGYYLMIDEMRDLPEGMYDTFASLHPNTKNRSPDEAFTLVPFEKGFQFLVYIESLIGEINFRNFLKFYATNEQFRSVNWEDFQTIYLLFLKQETSLQTYKDGENIDWDAWIFESGLPPKEFQPFTSFEYDEVAALANKFIQFNGTSQPKNAKDLFGWTQLKITVFLDYFRAHKYLLNRRILIQLQDTYQFQEMENQEVSFRWLTLCAEARYETPIVAKHTEDFLSQTGRVKYLIPIYEAFVETGHTDKAEKYLKQNKDFYHPIANDLINKIIHGENYDEK